MSELPTRERPLRLHSSWGQRVAARALRAMLLGFNYFFVLLVVLMTRALVLGHRSKMTPATENALLLGTLLFTVAMFLWARRRRWGVRKSELHLHTDHYAVGHGPLMFEYPYQGITKLHVTPFDRRFPSDRWVLTLTAKGAGGIRMSMPREQAVAAIASVRRQRPELMPLGDGAALQPAVEALLASERADVSPGHNTADDQSAPHGAGILTGGLAPLDERHPAFPVLQRKPWLTGGIAVLCVVLYLLGEYWGNGLKNAMLWRMGANSGVNVAEHGEWWRLLASAFLHGNFLHLALNMIALLSFGPLLEKLLGTARYWVLYATSALAGGLASAALNTAGISVGASGAIWGLMAAGVALTLWPRGLLPPEMLKTARQQALIPLGLNVAYSFQPGIDLYAHFGGGLAGFGLMALGVVTRGVPPLWRQTPSKAAAAATAAPTTASASAESPDLPTTIGGQSPSAPHPEATGRVQRTFRATAFALAALSLGSLGLALLHGQPWRLRHAPTLRDVAVPRAHLTLALPSLLPAAPEEARDSSGTVLSYGEVGTDPVVVELVILPLPAPVSAAELPAALAQEKAAFATAKLSNTLPSGAIQDGAWGSHPYLRATYSLGGGRATVLAAFTLIDDVAVMLRIYHVTDLPAAWSGVPQQMLAAVRPSQALR